MVILRKHLGFASAVLSLSCGERPLPMVAIAPALEQSASASPAPLRETVADAGAASLPPGAHPLEGLGFDLPLTDLAPLADIVGERRVVGLGESVHTSGGYYQAKARVLRFLVEKMGFRVFAMETPWGDALTATRYLATCDGSAKEAILPLSPVYLDVSLLVFFNWACTFNREHATDRLQFWGFDVQEPWHDFAELERFATAAAPTKVRWLNEQLKTCNGFGATSQRPYWDSPDGQLVMGTAPYPEKRHSACMAGLARVTRWLESSAPAFEPKVGAERLGFARIAAQSIAAFQEEALYGNRDPVKSSIARDVGMGVVFAALKSLEFSEQKVVAWAHNSHLAGAPARMRGEGTRGAVFGERLSAMFGDDYFPIALVGYRVKTSWHFPAPALPADEADLELQLHRLGRPLLLVNLRPGGADAAFASEAVHRVSGYQAIPSEQFGAALFIDESPPMQKVK
jgi:erythromycin esterase